MLLVKIFKQQGSKFGEERREAKELFCYLFLGKFQIKYMIGKGNKDKRGEKVEAIRIKHFNL